MSAFHPLDTWFRFVAMQMSPEQAALNLERNVGLDARKLIAGAKKYRAILSQVREVRGMSERVIYVVLAVATATFFAGAARLIIIADEIGEIVHQPCVVKLHPTEGPRS